MTVIGWCGAWDEVVPRVNYNADRKRALVERIRKRKYNFNFFDHEMLPYASPVFDDRTTCILTKHEWDSVLAEAYKDIPLGQRLMPQDVIDDAPINGVLYEKKKFYQEGEQNNG